MAHALRAWAINRGGKNSVRNLLYGLRTRLVRGMHRPRLLLRYNLKTEDTLWKHIKCCLSTIRRRNLKTCPVILDMCFEDKSLWLEKLHLRDGLVWTVGLTVEMKLLFPIPPEQCGPNMKLRTWHRTNRLSSCFVFAQIEHHREGLKRWTVELLLIYRLKLP